MLRQKIIKFFILTNLRYNISFSPPYLKHQPAPALFIGGMRDEVSYTYAVTVAIILF